MTNDEVYSGCSPSAGQRAVTYKQKLEGGKRLDLIEIKYNKYTHLVKGHV